MVLVRNSIIIITGHSQKSPWNLLFIEQVWVKFKTVFKIHWKHLSAFIFQLKGCITEKEVAKQMPCITISCFSQHSRYKAALLCVWGKAASEKSKWDSETPFPSCELELAQGHSQVKTNTEKADGTQAQFHGKFSFLQYLKASAIRISRNRSSF